MVHPLWGPRIAPVALLFEVKDVEVPSALQLDWLIAWGRARTQIGMWPCFITLSITMM